jgi:hypothetical protein
MEREESNDENIHRGKFIVKPVELYFKRRKITIDRFGEVKENIRLRIWNDTEDHTKGMNANKMDMNDKEHQKRNQEVTVLV